MRVTTIDLKSISVYTVYTNKKGEKTMAIKERKFREVGNSVVLTISKEFLKENGLNPGDTVFLDEEKLRAAITKKQTLSDEIDVAISQALTEYDTTFRELVDK